VNSSLLNIGEREEKNHDGFTTRVASAREQTCVIAVHGKVDSPSSITKLCNYKSLQEDISELGSVLKQEAIVTFAVIIKFLINI
jgi:hypothetical protein